MASRKNSSVSHRQNRSQIQCVMGIGVMGRIGGGRENGFSGVGYDFANRKDREIPKTTPNTKQSQRAKNVILKPSQMRI